MTNFGFRLKNVATIGACFAKKIAVTAIAITVSISAVSAQTQGDMAAGGHFVIGANSDIPNVGFGAKFRYNLIDQLRLEGALTAFVPKKTEGERIILLGTPEYTYNMVDFSVNGHFLIPLSEKFTFYPLAGFSIVSQEIKRTLAGITTTVDEDDGGIFLNAGVGFDFLITDRFAINLEPKMLIGAKINFFIAAGLLFNF